MAWEINKYTILDVSLKEKVIPYIVRFPNSGGEVMINGLTHLTAAK